MDGIKTGIRPCSPKPAFNRAVISTFVFLAGFLFGPAPPAAGIEDPPADYILVEKSLRKMTLFASGRSLKEYRVALGGAPMGPKLRRGDLRTPEGKYVIEGRNDRSPYHRSLRVSYPGESDIRRALEQGLDPGGDIMIHGIGEASERVGRLHPWMDWTKGCIAVGDDEIEEIWRLVPDGTPIEIIP